MKKSFAVYMIMLFAILACIAESPKETPMTTEEKEVYATYKAINNAMIKKDRVAMELYFNDNLTFTHMSGKKQTSRRVHWRNHGRNSKLLQSGYKGLFNQCGWRHRAHESHPHAHGKSLWN